MFISKDVYFFKRDKGVLAYNYQLNKACFIDGEICDKLERGDLHTIQETLPEDMLRVLLHNGILYENFEDYSHVKFVPPSFPKPRLEMVYFHVTQRCNLHCSYCYDANNIGKTDELTYLEIETLAEQLKTIGIRHIVLTGGEPLLRKDILKIVKLFKALNMYVGLLSNGTLISQNNDVLDKIDYAIISLDTLSEKDNHRKGLDIAALKESLTSLSSPIRKKISLRSVISKSNAESWREVKGFAEKYGMSFKSVLCLPNNLSAIENMPSTDVMEPEPQTGKKKKLSGEGCGACITRIAINANGDVYPCQALVTPDLYITNIKQNDWQQTFLESNITRDFLGWNIDKTEHCQTCNLRYLCGGGCRAIAYNLYRSIYACNECLCEHLKKSIHDRVSAVIDSSL